MAHEVIIIDSISPCRSPHGHSQYWEGEGGKKSILVYKCESVTNLSPRFGLVTRVI